MSHGSVSQHWYMSTAWTAPVQYCTVALICQHQNREAQTSLKFYSRNNNNQPLLLRALISALDHVYRLTRDLPVNTYHFGPRSAVTTWPAPKLHLPAPVDKHAPIFKRPEFHLTITNIQRLWSYGFTFETFKAKEHKPDKRYECILSRKYHVISRDAELG